jgi:hypothetical protein
VRVQYLWIQDAINEKEIDINKMNTLENPADVLTKFLNVESFDKHVKKINLEFPSVSTNILELKCSEANVRIKAILRHLHVVESHGKWLDHNGGSVCA